MCWQKISFYVKTGSESNVFNVCTLTNLNLINYLTKAYLLVLVVHCNISYSITVYFKIVSALWKSPLLPRTQTKSSWSYMTLFWHKGENMKYTPQVKKTKQQWLSTVKHKSAEVILKTPQCNALERIYLNMHSLFTTFHQKIKHLNIYFLINFTLKMKGANMWWGLGTKGKGKSGKKGTIV